MPSTVVLTRAPEDDAPLAHRLRREGARVIELPCLRIEPVMTDERLRHELRSLSSDDRLVFTSRAGVDAVRRAIAAGDVRAPVAAVGPGTAHRCAEWGIEAWTPSVPTGATVGRELALGSGAVVLVRGERADHAIVAELTRRGAHVREVIAYRAVPDVRGDIAAAREAVGAGATVVLASPAAADALALAIGADTFASACVVAIGPTTAAHVVRRLVRPPRVAEAPTTDAIFLALEVRDAVVHS